MDNKKKRKFILKTSYFLEASLSLVILVAVTLGIFDTLRIIFTTYIVNFNQPIDYEQINGIFAQILLLVIGVEIAVMLTLRKQTALLEVLLYGIARKMLLVPKGSGISEVFIGVIAIAGLFVIRKYLLDNKHYEEEVKEDPHPDHLI
ncbi:hypothetical protein [Peptostreptococcus porci]|uniref:hypothetical protein n=1 Tax=Peptostreptococcus porci TaxID=2652282 RepID=UPI002A8D9B14|nr:hypothetical protein [Peptostreptococcus porci]MDY4560680.1 hypothetical protein [Peptostreptococcus porci]MDY5435121.1 hypothetical protein [Peptostreptococcus porci]